MNNRGVSAKPYFITICRRLPWLKSLHHIFASNILQFCNKLSCFQVLVCLPNPPQFPTHHKSHSILQWNGSNVFSVARMEIATTMTSHQGWTGNKVSLSKIRISLWNFAVEDEICLVGWWWVLPREIWASGEQLLGCLGHQRLDLQVEPGIRQVQRPSSHFRASQTLSWPFPAPGPSWSWWRCREGPRCCSLSWLVQPQPEPSYWIFIQIH